MYLGCEKLCTFGCAKIIFLSMRAAICHLSSLGPTIYKLVVEVLLFGKLSLHNTIYTAGPMDYKLWSTPMDYLSLTGLATFVATGIVWPPQ